MRGRNYQKSYGDKLGLYSGCEVPPGIRAFGKPHVVVRCLMDYLTTNQFRMSSSDGDVKLIEHQDVIVFIHPGAKWAVWFTVITWNVFLQTNFFQNGQIRKDISGKPIAERTFPESVYQIKFLNGDPRLLQPRLQTNKTAHAYTQNGLKSVGTFAGVYLTRRTCEGVKQVELLCW